MASNDTDLSRVAGPSSMARPAASRDDSSRTQQSASQQTQEPRDSPQKKKKHRAGRKHRKQRRQSFIAPSEITDDTEAESRPGLMETQRPTQQSGFYRMNSGNRSNTSLESEALLDHRDVGPLRQRRPSVHQHGFGRASLAATQRQQHRTSPPRRPRVGTTSRVQRVQEIRASENEDDEGERATDRTPLLARSGNRSQQDIAKFASGAGYGSSANRRQRTRPGSIGSNTSARRLMVDIGQRKASPDDDDYDVNNPPSMPASPVLGSLDDVMINDHGGSNNQRGRDAVIDIDPADDRELYTPSPDALRRRSTVADLAERDVCFPGDAGMSEIGEEDEGETRSHHSSRSHRRRRRARVWPDFEILEEFSREEKEERTQEQIRAKKLVEPVMIEGRLRRQKKAWHREEDDAPFRFTYFNEMLDATIHARTISDLCQDGTTFHDLFLPDPVEMSDDSDVDEEMVTSGTLQKPSLAPLNGHPDILSRQGSIQAGDSDQKRSPLMSQEATGPSTPTQAHPSRPSKRYGPRPTFWLDVLNPTESEMKVLAKAFGIHQLTVEDILLGEEREKVELFQSYYFVNYRSFEQDESNEDYLEPVNMYVVVFRDGVISFHSRMTPHPANVRRRIRQLNDYMSPTADWISYAIIDDITDVYAPLVSQIEKEVDNIDDQILYLHQSTADENLGQVQETKEKAKSIIEKVKGLTGKKRGKGADSDSASHFSDKSSMGRGTRADGEVSLQQSGGDMLRRVGECRKKVMGLYRLLGNKADVIKGFAKRCNEHWEVAPRSEIGLYLGDIQDHIVTMTGNLSHYENLLSRAHSNYLAQINIRMNERAEQTADVLGKLTVLGTIVLPMNIVTGMWGMNVWVPGQEYEGDLTWFWCITAGLFTFGFTCYFIAKRVYKIV